MMSELKKSWKLIKYGYQFKINIALGVLFILLGVVFMLTSSANNADIGVLLGAVYLLLGPSMFAQTAQNMLFSQCVASSYQHRLLDGKFINIVMAVNCLLAYIVVMILLAINPFLQMGSFVNSGNVMISVAVTIALVMLCAGMAWKYFVVSTILVFISYFGCIIIHGLLLNVVPATNIFVGSILGLVILAVGNLLSILVRKALYKKPLSPLAGGSGLRKAMQ